MKKKLIFSVIIAGVFSFSSCKKTDIIEKENMSEEASNLSKDGNIYPANAANPYDYVGKHVERALHYANGPSDLNEFQFRLDEYFEQNRIEMINLEGFNNEKEDSFLNMYSKEIQSSNTTREKIIVSKKYEALAISNSLFSSEEKKRVLYTISSLKYTFNVLENLTISIHDGEAAFLAFRKIGLTDIGWGPGLEPKINCDEGNQIGIGGEQCVTRYICQRSFIGINFGKPFIRDSNPYGC
jgi:hypothetical protein